MSEQDEQKFAEKLTANRRSGLGRRESIKKAVAGNMDLSKYIEVEDYIFVGMALAIAFLKDISDFVGIGSLPVIGTVVTIMATIFIGAAMYLAGSSSPRKNILFFRKAATYGIGMGIEMFFGLNFLPIETLMVVYLYYLLLKERAGLKSGT